MLNFELKDAEATARLGGALASLFRPDAARIVYLYGDLGAGKTTLVRGLLRQLGITGTIRSPTYTLLEPYDTGSLQLIHLDLYRLRDPSELEQLGLRDYAMGKTSWLVEWPQQAGGQLPKPDLEVWLLHNGESRQARIESIHSDELRASFKTLL